MPPIVGAAPLPPSAEMRAVFCFSGGQSGMSSWSHCSPVPDWARVVWGLLLSVKVGSFLFGSLLVCVCVCVSVSLFRRCFGLHCGFGVERDTCLGRPRIAGSRYSGYLGCSASDDRGTLCLMGRTSGEGLAVISQTAGIWEECCVATIPIKKKRTSARDTKRLHVFFFFWNWRQDFLLLVTWVVSLFARISSQIVHCTTLLT